MSDGALGAGLAIVLLGSQVILLLLPRPVVPRDMPPFRFDRRAAQAQVRTDREEGARAPVGPIAMGFDRLYRDLGLAETGAPEPIDVAEHRRSMIRAAVVDLVRAHGDAGIGALRARYVGLFDGLTPASEGAARRGLLGSFPRLAERFGLTENGRGLAPAFVLRTAYKARFNVVIGRDVDDGFSEVERDAYHGWIALKMDALPIDQRLASVGKLGPTYAAALPEIRALLLFEAGEFARARELYWAQYARFGSARFRNFALAAEAFARE